MRVVAVVAPEAGAEREAAAAVDAAEVRVDAVRLTEECVLDLMHPRSSLLGVVGRELSAFSACAAAISASRESWALTAAA